MPRQVLLFLAVLIGPLILAAWILSIERPDTLVKPEDHDATKGRLSTAEGSLLDRTICVETGQAIRFALSAIGIEVNPVDRGCKVTHTGGGKFEVESSFLVRERTTPVRYTVLIIDGVIDESEEVLNGKWDRIRLHGFHRNFVPLPDFGIPNARFETFTEQRMRAFLGIDNSRPLLRHP